MNNDMLLIITGAMMVTGALLILWSSVRDRRQGDAPLRGQIVGASALAVYGGLVLAGKLFTGSPLAMVMQGAVAVTVIAGAVMSIRDRRKAREFR